MQKIANTFFVSLLLVLLLSCKNDKENSAEQSNDERREFVLQISMKQIDSIKKSELSKPIFLEKATLELDSVNTAEVMVPLTRYLDDYSFSTTKVNFLDLENDSVETIPYTTYRLNTDFDNSKSDFISLQISDNPNLYPVSDVKNLNEIEKIIYEDKNSLLYIDNFGYKKMFYRNYLPEKKLYCIYTIEAPKYEDPKMGYSYLFSALHNAQNIFSYDKIAPENLTWERLKPTIAAPELIAYEIYYKSFSKEVRFFMTGNELQKINNDNFSVALYRDQDHSENMYEQTAEIANLNYSGNFEELGFDDTNLRESLSNVLNPEDHIQFVKKLGENSILVKTYDEGGFFSSEKEPEYYSITPVTTPKGQFYLTHQTNSSGKDVIVLMNEYFSKHLKI